MLGRAGGIYDCGGGGANALCNAHSGVKRKRGRPRHGVGGFVRACQARLSVYGDCLGGTLGRPFVVTLRFIVISMLIFICIYILVIQLHLYGEVK